MLGHVTQSVEYRSFKPQVAGSSPVVPMGPSSYLNEENDSVILFNKSIFS